MIRRGQKNRVTQRSRELLSRTDAVNIDDVRPSVTYTVELNRGNNLIGFPFAKAEGWQTNDNLRYQIDEIFTAEHPEIISIIGESVASNTLSPGNWYGSANTIDPTMAYYVDVNIPQGTTLTFTKEVPMFIKPGTEYLLEVGSLGEGLNYISYPGRFPMTVQEAFPPEISYYIYEIIGASQASNDIGNGNWIGSLQTLFPNMGYLVRVRNLQPYETYSFRFPRAFEEEQEPPLDEVLPGFTLEFEQGSCPDGDYEIFGECYFAQDIITLQDFIHNSNEYCKDNNCNYNTPGFRHPLNLCYQGWGPQDMVEEGGIEDWTAIGDEHPFAYLDVPPNRLRSFTCLDPDIICGESECPESEIYSLYGEIPDSIGNWNELRRFDIQDHQLSGIIPMGFQNMSKLYRFELRGTKIQGFEAQGYFNLPAGNEVVGNLNDICNENHFNYWGNIGCTGEFNELGLCPNYSYAVDFKLNYNCIGVCPPPNVGDGTLDLNGDGIMEGPAPYCMLESMNSFPQLTPTQCNCDGRGDDRNSKSPKSIAISQCDDPTAFNFNPDGFGCSKNPLDNACCEYYIGNMR
jgi:hypothetical protein